jgi:hypothetical protein
VIAPAGAHARLYREGGMNELAEKVPISVAAESGRAFVVHVARDILAIDADALEAEAMTLAAQLTAAGERPVILDSGGGPGRLHVFARIEDPRQHERWRLRAKELGLGPRDVIRPPYAPHRNGLARSVLHGADDPHAALAILTPAVPLPKVSARVRKLLRHGDDDQHSFRTADGAIDRSAVLQAIVDGYVAAGWREGEIRRRLLDTRHAGGAKLRDRTDAADLVRQSYQKAVERIAADPHHRRPITAAALQAIEAERDRAAAEVWKGTGGHHRRAVLGVHHDAAQQAGGAVYVLSMRQVAERAGLGDDLSSAKRAQRRLRMEGWLDRLPPRKGEGRNAPSRWRLPTPETAVTAPTASHPPVFYGVTNRRFRPNHDALRFGAVGKAKGLLLAAIESGEAADVADLAKITCTNERTVREHVQALVALGLLVRVNGRRLARGPLTLDEVAERLGFAGVGALQRSTFETQRERRRAEQAARHERTAPLSGATVYVLKAEPARTAAGGAAFVAWGSDRSGATPPASETEAKRPERRAIEVVASRAAPMSGDPTPPGVRQGVLPRRQRADHKPEAATLLPGSFERAGEAPVREAVGIARRVPPQRAQRRPPGELIGVVRDDAGVVRIVVERATWHGDLNLDEDEVADAAW